jgi:hypothetical protein
MKTSIISFEKRGGIMAFALIALARLPCLAQVDTNENGISDLWEMRYQASEELPDADADGDGMTTLEESIAGTDPFDSQSVMELTRVDELDPLVSVSWSARARGMYQLQKSSDLSEPWQDIGSEVHGHVGEWLQSAGALGEGQAFYRVKILPPSGYNSNPYILAQQDSDVQGQDTDQDGYPDLIELYEGGNPFDSLERLQPPKVVLGSFSKLSWPSIVGKSYHIQSTANLSQPWEDENGSFRGNGNLITAFVSLKGDVGRFFRVVVTDSDTDGDGVNDWEEAQVGLDPTLEKSSAVGPDDRDLVLSRINAETQLSLASSGPVANITRLENGGVLISRKGGYEAVTISYTVGGTAVAGVDYAPFTGTLVIPFGQDSVKLPVVPLAGSALLMSESVVITLQNSASYQLNGEISQRVNVIREVVINVKDYGAVGDGVTDDTGAIQLTINALETAANHNTLYFPQGNYRLNSITQLQASTGTSDKGLLILGSADLADKDIVVTCDPGAALYSTASPVRAHMFVTYASYRSLQFYGMKFEKDSVPLSPSPGTEPSGADGVSVIRLDNRVVEMVRFRNCDFINCHGAFFFYGSTYEDRGKMRILDVRDCNMLNPYGPNTQNSQEAWGGGTQCNMKSWVGLAIYEKNHFEGGGVDMTDPATCPGGRVKDGSHFGSPQRLVFRNNTVLRMGVEAVYSTNGNQLLAGLRNDFMMPAVGGNESVSVELSGTAVQFVAIGDIINIRTPLAPGQNTGNNLMRVISTAPGASIVTLENTGNPGNKAAGTLITAGNPVYMEIDDPNEAEITDNFVSGVMPPGGRAFNLTSGIVSNARSVIKRNYIRGFSIGVNIYKETRTTMFPGARGSIVKNNIIFTRDTVQFPGVFGRGIQLWSNEERAVGNFIMTPVATRFTGVVSRGKDALIRNNYITTKQIYNTGFSSSNRSVGIAAGNESYGTLMDSNYTFGMDVGAGPENHHQIIIHHVRNHHSYHDINARDVYGSRPYPE